MMGRPARIVNRRVPYAPCWRRRTDDRDHVIGGHGAVTVAATSVDVAKGVGIGGLELTR
jgi:hypothetical protein